MSRRDQLLLTALLAALTSLGACARDRLDQSAEFRGYAVSYDDYNTSAAEPAIVLVHGWASDRQVWRHQVGPFSENHRVLSIDLIGHGTSEAPSLDYSMDTMAGSINAVMDHAGVGRAVLVGHSNGTPVIRQFFRRHRHRTTALVAVDGALVQIMPPEVAEQFFAPLRDEGYREILSGMIDQMDSAGSISEEDFRAIKSMALATDHHVLISTFEGAQDPTIWTPDPIEVPMLVVLAPSPFWGASYEQKVLDLSPEAEIRSMEGVSHFLMMDDPEQFNALVLEFVDRVSR